MQDSSLEEIDPANVVQELPDEVVDPAERMPQLDSEVVHPMTRVEQLDDEVVKANEPIGSFTQLWRRPMLRGMFLITRRSGRSRERLS